MTEQNNNQGEWTKKDEQIVTGALIGGCAALTLVNPILGTAAFMRLGWRAMRANQKGKDSIWSNLDE